MVANVLNNVAVFVHLLFLIVLTIESGHVPLAGAFQAMSTFMFFFAILSRIIAPDSKDYSLGLFNTSLLFILQLISALYISPITEISEILKDVFFEVHVILNLIGYAAFSSAFLLSLMYLLLFYEIKSDKLGYFYDRLPSLAYLEKLNQRAITIGFIFSTLGILSGAFTGMYAWGKFWAWDPKLISAIITWLIYGIGLMGSYRYGWHGKKIALLSFFCFLLILFSMLVITQYFSGIHSFN
jgi:ABC-type transport system involved in cytochrome c biogenesis permease subunit